MPPYRFKLDELPPSTNHLYRRTRYGQVKTAEAKAFEELSYYTMPVPRKALAVPCRLDVTFTLAQPAKLKRRDLDNMLKALLDVVQLRGAVTNDNFVYEINCRKVGGDKDGIVGTLSALE